MPGMNKSSRTISLLTSLLAELESNLNRNVIEALAVLDELRRLQHKWDEQLEAGNPRRIKSDYAALQAWYLRWLKATESLVSTDPAGLSAARAEVEERIGDIEQRWWPN
jgi:hypothetical protein